MKGSLHFFFLILWSHVLAVAEVKESMAVAVEKSAAVAEEKSTAVAAAAATVAVAVAVTSCFDCCLLWWIYYFIVVNILFYCDVYIILLC